MEDEEDRISQLPEPILDHILSLLPWEDAAHMAVLSKACRDVWASFPVFDFNFDQKISGALSLASGKKVNLENETEDFISWVDNTLRNIQLESGKAIIENLRIYMFLTDPNFATCIDGWIELATKNCLKQLDLEIRNGFGTLRYSLPPRTFLAKSLEVLKLSGCILDQQLFGGNGDYSHLKKVYFVKVFLDDVELQDFLNSCPLLQELTILRCEGLKNLVLPPHPKLGRVTVTPCNYGKEFDRIDIEAANLDYFCYESISKPLRMFHIGVVDCKNLTELNIKGVSVAADLLEGLLSKLPLLKTLALIRCAKMESVMLSHRSLQKLFLFLRSGVVQLEIETPNLLSFRYGSDRLPIFFTIYAPNLQESCLRLSPKGHVDALWFPTLRRYLSNFVQMSILCLEFGLLSRFLLENTFILDKLNEYEIPPPFPVVENLRLEGVGSISSCEAFLNGLLWSCHPRTLSVASNIKCNAKFIRLVCEKLINRDEDPQCCDSRRIKCCQHYIKELTIEGLMAEEDMNAFLSSLPTKGRNSEVRFELKW